MEEVGEGLRDPKRIGTPQADKEATNINPWGLPKTEPPSQEQAWAGPITHTHTHTQTLLQICSRYETWSSCESPNN